jgi:hypothetical protein
MICTLNRKKRQMCLHSGTLFPRTAPPHPQMRLQCTRQRQFLAHLGPQQVFTVYSHQDPSRLKRVWLPLRLSLVQHVTAAFHDSCQSSPPHLLAKTTFYQKPHCIHFSDWLLASIKHLTQIPMQQTLH